jgi:hypothetical protein
MSYDPSGLSPELPPEGEAPYGLPPSGDAAVAAARAQVQMPALFLMIVGAMNFLVTLYFIGNGIYTAMVPAQRLWEQAQTTQASLEKMLGVKADAEKKSPDEMKTQALLFNAAAAGLTGLFALLSLLGGWRMYKLRSFGLSVVGALAAAVPCLSGSACCGVGEAVGLWALIVLLRPEVREAFR